MLIKKFIAGMVAFGMRLPPLHIGLLVAGCQLAAALINAFGLYVIPALVRLGALYRYLAGYGIFFLAVLITLASVFEAGKPFCPSSLAKSWRLWLLKSFNFGRPVVITR